LTFRWEEFVRFKTFSSLCYWRQSTACRSGISTSASVQRWAGWVTGRSLVLGGSELENTGVHFFVSLGRNICMWEQVAPSGEMAWDPRTLGAVWDMLFRGTHIADSNRTARVPCKAPNRISGQCYCLCTRQFRNVLVNCYNFAVVSENITACVRLTIGTKCLYGSETHLSYWRTTFHNNSFVYWLLFG